MDLLTGVAISGTGSSLPSRVVHNEDFEASLDTSDEWIHSRTGIRERRHAGPDETSATLGAIAAQNAVARTGLTAGDIDLIVCATVTPDLSCPSTACLIQAKLGCRPIPSFDLNAACSGFVFALATAGNFIRAGAVQNALVIGSDILSRAVDITDRNTCVLFGDGAGAVVISRTPDDTNGLHRVRLFSDGNRQELIQMPSRVTTNPPPGKSTLPHLRWLRMNGREVFKFAVQKLASLIDQAMADCLAMGRRLALVVPHQVNSRIIAAALKLVDYPDSRVVLNLQNYGNTSAASVPIALDEVVRSGRAASGDTILLAAFGGGLTWSSALVTM